MLKTLIYGMAAALALGAHAAPAGAQGSDSHKFLQAVKSGDGAKVEEVLATPGTNIINSKDREDGDTGLHIVARDRNLEWLRYLIGKGARTDIQNREGDTPLATAAQIGWIEGVEALLARGAGVNVANGRGETPLILAVHKRDVAMVRLLLSQGADPNRADRIAGYTALDYAKRDGRSPAILKLLEAPAAPVKKAQGPGL